MDTNCEPVYLKKSANFFKIYGGLFLFSILASTIVRPILKDYPLLVDMLVGIPVLPFFIMAPMGLVYSLKSIKRKEGAVMIRLRYFAGHLLFCCLIIIIVTVFVNDISELILK